MSDFQQSTHAYRRVTLNSKASHISHALERHIVRFCLRSCANCCSVQSRTSRSFLRRFAIRTATHHAKSDNARPAGNHGKGSGRHNWGFDAIRDGPLNEKLIRFCVVVEVRMRRGTEKCVHWRCPCATLLCCPDFILFLNLTLHAGSD